MTSRKKPPITPEMLLEEVRALIGDCRLLLAEIEKRNLLDEPPKGASLAEVLEDVRAMNRDMDKTLAVLQGKASPPQPPAAS